MSTNKVLVLCTGNSCRSQMAEGYLRALGKQYAKYYSAGIEAHGVNPIAVKVMEEDNVDISHYTSDTLDVYADIRFDFVITVCDNAQERCPTFPTTAIKVHQDFEDPAKFEGDEEATLNKFREVRDQIKKFCQQFINNNLTEHVSN